MGDVKRWIPEANRLDPCGLRMRLPVRQAMGADIDVCVVLLEMLYNGGDVADRSCRDAVASMRESA